MGLRGKVPPVGADLFGAGPYHLPLPEGEDVTRDSGNGPLTGVPALIQSLLAGLVASQLLRGQTSRLRDA